MIGVVLDESGLVPVYVGQSVDPGRRWRQHQFRCHSRLLAWRLKRGSEMGLRHEFQIVEWCSPDVANAREVAWLGRVLADGWRPANCGPWNEGDLREIASELELVTH